MKHARQGLLWIAAILSAGYGAVLLWRFAVVAPFPGYMGHGRFSSKAWQELVPFALAVLANRLVAQRAQGSSSYVRTLHRAHSIVLLVLVAVVCAWLITVLVFMILWTQHVDTNLQFEHAVTALLRVSGAFLSRGQLVLLGVTLALSALEEPVAAEPPDA